MQLAPLELVLGELRRARDGAAVEVAGEERVDPASLPEHEKQYYLDNFDVRAVDAKVETLRVRVGTIVVEGWVRIFLLIGTTWRSC